MSDDIQAVVDAARQELARFGGNLKSIQDSTARDLAAVRSEVEGLKSAAMTDPLVQTKIEAFGASLGTKIEALQTEQAKATKQIDERIDAVETAMRRGMGTGGRPEDEGFRKNAILFTRGAAQLRRREVPDELGDDQIQFDGYRAYRKAFVAMLRRDERALPEEHRKALVVASDPDGGYLVDPEVSARILKKVYESSPVRQLATVETITGQELEVRVDNDEADFEWVTEVDLPGANKTPQLGKRRIVAHEMATRPKATQQLLEDANIDAAAWLDRKVAEKFARGENRAFLLGSGSGQPRGLLTYPAGTVGDAIEQLPSGVVDGFTYERLIQGTFALKESYHARAVWLMQRSAIAKVMLIKDGTEYMMQAVVQPGVSRMEPVLNGYPIRMAADMPAPVANAKCALFGDLASAYTVVDRLGITTMRDPFTSKPFVEFYTRRRVGGDVVNFEAVKILVGAV